MIRLGVIVCVVFLTTSYSFVDADRLTSRSDGSILLGIGALDAKKQNVMFRECKQKNSEIYSLKRFTFEKYPKTADRQTFGPSMESIWMVQQSQLQQSAVIRVKSASST